MRRAGIYLILLTNLAATVGPLLWVGLTSLKPSRDIFLHPFQLPDPARLAWDNYTRAWTVGRLGECFGNSLVVTLTSVVATVLLGAMAAHALARYRFAGRDSVHGYLLLGLTVPLQLAAVPLFFQLGRMGLLNSRLGLILVFVATGLPFAVFILVGFFRSLPQELLEAAVLDGCTPWQAFVHVMLPLARPGVITVAVFTFMGLWNEYFLSFMLLSGQGSESVRTLPLGLANLTMVSQYRTDYGSLFAGLVLVTLPALLVYLALQRHLTDGIAAGAVKG